MTRVSEIGDICRKTVRHLSENCNKKDNHEMHVPILLHLSVFQMNIFAIFVIVEMFIQRRKYIVYIAKISHGPF